MKSAAKNLGAIGKTQQSALAAPKPAGTNLRSTTVRMPPEMRQAVEALALEKYGQRGLARWIERALEELLKRPDVVMLVGAGEGNMAFTESKVVRLTKDAQSYLNEVVRRVRILEPTREGVSSEALRAAFALAIKNAGALPRSGDSVVISEKPGKLVRRTSPSKAN